MQVVCWVSINFPISTLCSQGLAGTSHRQNLSQTHRILLIGNIYKIFPWCYELLNSIIFRLWHGDIVSILLKTKPKLEPSNQCKPLHDGISKHVLLPATLSSPYNTIWLGLKRGNSTETLTQCISCACNVAIYNCNYTVLHVMQHCILILILYDSLSIYLSIYC